MLDMKIPVPPDAWATMWEGMFSALAVGLIIGVFGLLTRRIINRVAVIAPTLVAAFCA